MWSPKHTYSCDSVCMYKNQVLSIQHNAIGNTITIPYSSPHRIVWHATLQFNLPWPSIEMIQAQPSIWEMTNDKWQSKHKEILSHSQFYQKDPSLSHLLFYLFFSPSFLIYWFEENLDICTITSMIYWNYNTYIKQLSTVIARHA